MKKASRKERILPLPPETSGTHALETAYIVHPQLSLQGGPEKEKDRFLEDTLEEAEGLAHAIHLDVIHTETVRLTKINPSHLFGKGNVERIGQEIGELEPAIVIVNHNLSPIQQRNLERDWKVKVIDRTGLILEIFGERAQTREGRIQVDLAQLEYQKSRLVRSWTHLERQRGGAGFMGGPGETQLEIDRRLITDRIAKLKKELEGVKKTRELGRKSREKVPYPIIALVGYTNAGKSTLFNRLTGASVFAEDLPFATLDPTLRKVDLPSGKEVIFSDTVGFISDLPTHLVAAFRATLEQVQYADVILHVRDISRADHERQKEDVIKVLEDLGVSYDQDERVFEIWNKVDACSEDVQEDILRKASFDDKIFVLSALTGQGVDALLAGVDQWLSRTRRVVEYVLPVTDGQALSWLHDTSEVLETLAQDQNIVVSVHIDEEDRQRFKKRFGYEPAGAKQEENEKEHYAGY